jgi:hypothetical protein
MIMEPRDHRDELRADRNATAEPACRHQGRRVFTSVREPASHCL